MFTSRPSLETWTLMVFPFPGRFSGSRTWGGNDNPNARPSTFPSLGKCLVCGLGKGDAETLLGQLDAMHGERSGLAVPLYLLKAKFLSACGSPPSSGLPTHRVPSLLKACRMHPVWSRLTKSKITPWYSPPTLSRETRMMLERL